MLMTGIVVICDSRELLFAMIITVQKGKAALLLSKGDGKQVGRTHMSLYLLAYKVDSTKREIVKVAYVFNNFYETRAF